jgi:hypothetical protein
VTGEVEEFTVDDQDRRLPEAEHDRIARGVAELVAVSPRLHEVGRGAAPARQRAPSPEDEREPEPERRRDPARRREGA